MEGIAGKSCPQIVSVATAKSPKRYTQVGVVELFGIRDPRALKLFKKPYIKAITIGNISFLEKEDRL